MSYLILSSRLRRKVDYAIDILEFIESSKLRDAVRQELETLKSELVKFSNLLAKKENPLAENQMADAWKVLHENFLAHWQQMCTREELRNIVEQSNKLPINWLKIIEAEIKSDFESSAELDSAALRNIAQQRLLEYELVEFGESIKSLVQTRPPSCFISYAWGDKTHEDQVHQMAYLLKYAGIEVLLDIWCNKVNSIPAFTELVNKEKSDFVIIMGTHLLKQKYDMQISEKGSWVYEELEQVAVRKKTHTQDHGIIKLLLEGTAEKSFPHFLDPLPHDDTNFNLTQNYYEKFFNLLELLYEKYPVIKQLNKLRQAFQNESAIINQTSQAELMELLKLNTPVDYENQQAEKVNVFAKIKQASRLFSQFVERTFANELLYAEMLKNRLQDKYAENDKIERLFYPENPLPIANCYLHLALVEDKENKQQKTEVLAKLKKEAASAQRDYVLREYERIEHIQRKLAVHEILQECKTAIKRILIEGAAGTGKSTLCQRIAYDWSQRKAPWQNYKWLFHIRLRDLKSVDAHTKDYLGKLLQECFRHGDKELDDWQLERVRKDMRDNPRQVLFILDGYDELQIDTHTLNKLLEPLKEYDFMVTSRPGANFKTDIAKHHVAKEQLLHLAILGINDQQIKQYVNQFFNPHYTSVNPPELPTNPTDVTKALENNPSLWSLSHIPIQLELLCSMWGDEFKTMDITLTNLYELMLTKLLIRLHVERKHRGQHPGELFDYQLRKTYSKHLDYLSYLAYLGMKDNKIVLEKRGYIEKALRDLRITNPSQFFEDIKFLGLFKHRDDGKQGEFIHLTFQEFFAAKHWVKIFSKSVTQHEAIIFLTENKDNVRYQSMWWFVAGLLKENITLLELFFANLLGETKQDVLNQQLLAKPYRLLLSLRCLDESANQNKLAPISQSELLLPILKSYVENILVEYSKRKHLYVYGEYRSLISNLKISLCLIEKLNINDLLKCEMESGYQQTRINIAEIVMDLGCKTLPIVDELIQALITDGDEKSFNAGVKLSIWLSRTPPNPKLVAFLLNQLSNRDYSSYLAAKQLIKLGVERDKALEVYKYLINDLSEDMYKLNRLAAKQLIKLGEKKTEALAALMQQLTGDNAYKRYESAKLLIKLGEKRKEALDTLAENLNSDHPIARRDTAKLLIKLGEKKESVLAALTKDLNGDAWECLKAAKLLIQLGEKKAEVIAALQQNLSAADAGDRYQAAELLIQLGEKKAEALAALVENLSAEEKDIYYRMSLDKLIEFGGEEELELALAALLGDLSSKDVSERHNAAEMLIRLGVMGEALAALEKDLGSSDIRVRHQAAELLIKLNKKKEEALTALTKDLSALMASDRHIAIKTLIKLGEKREEVSTALLKELSAKDINDRHWAVKKFIESGKKRELMLKKEIVLADLLKDLSSKNWYGAAELLIQLGEKKEEAIVALQENLREADAWDRYSAAELLIKLDKKEEVLDILVKDLSSESISNRYSTAELLIQLDEKKAEAIAVLQQNLRAADAENRYRAAELLIQLNEKQAEVIAALKQNLRTAYAWDRERAAELLITLDKKEEVLDFLVEDLSSENISNKYSAAELLIQLGEKKAEAIAALQQNLSAADAGDRYQAAELLIRLGEKKAEAIAALQQNLSAADAWNRHRAADLLIQLGEKKAEAIAAMQKDLSTADAWDRHRAAELLIQLDEKKEEAIVALLQNLSAANAWDRHRAAKLLIQLGEKKEEAIVALQQNLSAADAGDRYQAAELLIQLGEKKEEAMIAALQKNLSAANVLYRERAAELLIQLGEKKELVAKKLDISNQAYKYLELGNSSMRRANLNQAISSYEQAMALFPEIECHHNLACCYHAKGEIDKADSTFKTAIKLNANSGIYCEYGHFLYQQKRYQDAIENLNIAMKLSEDFHGLYYGQLDKPVIDDYLRQEVERNDKIKIQSGLLANYLLVRCYQALHQASEMKQVLSTLIETAEKDPKQLLYRLIGYIFQTLHEESQAQDYFAKAELLTKVKAQEELIAKSSSSPAVTTFFHQTASNSGQDQAQADQTPNALVKDDQIELYHTKAHLK